MRIIVPIKQVPETSAVKMDEETGTMIREGVQAIVNPLDLYAIETAIRLREAHGGEVTVLSMGPPKAIAALQEAIAMGCDSAALISDKAFAGSDTWATSYVLAAACRKIGSYDLILCGERATDGDTGQVGPGIASFLDLPVITYVSRLDSLNPNQFEQSQARPNQANNPLAVDADAVLAVDMHGIPLAVDGTSTSCNDPHASVRVHRLIEDGYEVLEMKLPGVLTVVKEIADPRLPTLRGKQKARNAAIPTWTAADLDLQADKLGLNGSPTRVVRIFRPTVARQCQKLPAGDEAALTAACDKVVEFLQTKNLI